jgi:Tfp pilus assembly protein PilZ
VLRLNLPLGEKADWLKVFDPRGGGLFVPSADPPAVGTEVRVDLHISGDGPRVIFRGNVAWRRGEGDPKSPPGCGIALLVGEREKVNFMNGYVRGGLLNRRERRRLPLRLPIGFSLKGEKVIVTSVTRDINEEGLFIVSETPFPEETVLSFTVTVPGRAEPIQLEGIVSHTVIPEDEDTPGMGIRFVLDDGRMAEIAKIVDDLEEGFMTQKLPEEIIS